MKNSIKKLEKLLESAKNEHVEDDFIKKLKIGLQFAKDGHIEGDSFKSIVEFAEMELTKEILEFAKHSNEKDISHIWEEKERIAKDLFDQLIAIFPAYLKSPRTRKLEERIIAAIKSINNLVKEKDQQKLPIVYDFEEFLYLKEMLKSDYCPPTDIDLNRKMLLIIKHLSAIVYFYNLLPLIKMNAPLIFPYKLTRWLPQQIDLAFIKIIIEVEAIMTKLITEGKKADFTYSRTSRAGEAKKANARERISKGYRQVFKEWKSKHKIATDIQQWLAEKYKNEPPPHLTTIKRHVAEMKLPPFD